jgi:predicted PurR-regulated permease PerM
MARVAKPAEPEEPEEPEQKKPEPLTPYERAAYVTIVALLVFIFVFHLVPALVAGLLVFTLLAATTKRLRGPRLSHGAAKVIALFLLASVAVGVTMMVTLLLVGLVRGHAGDLPALFQKMADALDSAKERLGTLGVETPGLDAIRDAADVQAALSTWLREHALSLQKVGAGFGHFLLHATMGILAGLLVFFSHAPHASTGPLGVALSERVHRFADAFRMVVFAQVEISLINTALTAVYLLGILPLTGNKLPLTGTLIAVTFLAGLLPVVGNLVSNTVIVVISLGVGPWVAIGSLVFLVLVHKLEYLVNARIVGSRVNAAAWEVLVAILLFEVAFGVPGVVIAPVVYAWGKRELADRGLV